MVGQVLNDAIFDFFIHRFRLKRPEHLIPSDEDTGIVAVEIARIGCMMNAMV